MIISQKIQIIIQIQEIKLKNYVIFDVIIIKYIV